MTQWDESKTESFASGVLERIDELAEMNTAPALTDNNEDHFLYPKLIEVVKEELEAAMKPELLNRIDEIVVFAPLSPADLAMIAGLNIEKIVRRASEEHKLQLTVGQDLIDRVVLEGSASADQFGARPMRRAAQRYVEDSLSDAIVRGFLTTGDSAALELAPPHLDGKDRVLLVSADGRSVELEIEDSSGGIGSAPITSTSSSSSARISKTGTELEVQPVQ
jgi:C-terminal, D2-small domain, of ClpB protein